MAVLQGKRTRLALLVVLPLAAFAVPAATARSASAPVNIAVPTISGSAAQSATLTATNGNWNGDQPIAYALQWYRCATNGGSCAEIDGATAQSYVVVADDVGKTIRVRVTATNANGQSSSLSAPTSTVVSSSGPAPVNTSLPVVTGSAAYGATLTTSTGSWTGSPSPTYAYGWLQCDTSGASCNPIPGATSATYRVQAGDVGATLRAQVTATNSSGSVSVQSLPTTTVGRSDGPLATTPPGIVGSAAVGSTLTISTGGWSGSGAIDYAYEWERCDAQGAGCAPIDGATDRTYVVAADDAGSRLRATVVATDANGSTSASAGTTAVIGESGTAPTPAPTPAPAPTPGSPAPAPGAGVSVLPVTGAPGLVAQPIVSGLLEAGATLRTSDGSWTSAPGIRFTQAWFRCDAKGRTCRQIAGATHTTYRLGRADAGSTFRSEVTALNPSGSASARSDPTAAVGKGPAIRLRGGRYSIPAGSLARTDKLVVSRVRATGTHARPAVQVAVRDGRGNAVRGAAVSVTVRGYRVATAHTGRSGTATLRLRAKSTARHGRLAVSVRARTAHRGPSAHRVVKLRVR
jgi:hypothetical protein